MARLKQILNRPDLGYFGMALHDCKNGYNVGGVIRAVGAFDGRFVVASGTRWMEKGNWKNMDTEGAHLRFPCFLGVDDIFSYIPEYSKIVAVEVDDEAHSLVTFEHPKVATYVFGPEDGKLSDYILKEADYKVYIPAEYSLNLYSAATAIAYDRTAKILAKETTFPTDMGCPKCTHVHYSRPSHDPKLAHVDPSLKNCNACGTLYR